MSEEGPRVYGLAGCDQVRTARRWLDRHGIAHRFHDYRRDRLEEAWLRRWIDAAGWESLINGRGTTWRRLDPQQRALAGAAGAARLMLEHPSLIKRPLLEYRGRLLVGFDPSSYAALLTD